MNERPDLDVLATAIVDRLFTNGFGAVADRLALKQRIQQSVRRDAAAERDLGGWCRSAAVDQVTRMLHEHEEARHE